jgi:hypothetical protein
MNIHYNTDMVHPASTRIQLNDHTILTSDTLVSDIHPASIIIDKFIILFYDKKSHKCEEIIENWYKFKKISSLGYIDFNVIDFCYEGDDNVKVFKYFKIDAVPTIIKISPCIHNDTNSLIQLTIMSKRINLLNLLEFSDTIKHY